MQEKERNKKTKRRLNPVTMLITITLLAATLTGCASWKRFTTDVKSDFNNGLQRTITVYDANSNVMRTFEGKIDIQANDGGYVKFDYEGKRYMYYNCFIESIADID